MDPLAALNAELERALGPKPSDGTRQNPPTAPQSRSPGTPSRLPAQLVDLDGQPHEIAPQAERLRLFEPAPEQLKGQTFIDTDSEA
jgi:hypothetical protein